MSVQTQGLESVAGEWDALADAVTAPPFLRPGWFAASQRAFGGGVEILCARTRGVLAAVLPVRRGRLVLGAAANWHTPWFGSVAADEAATETLADALLNARAPRLDLSFLPPFEPLLPALRAHADARGTPFLERVVMRSPYVRLNGDWEAYDAAMPSKRRGDLRRRLRRLGERGEVSFECNSGTEALAERLATGFTIEASGWKGERGTAIASRPDTRCFYREVADWAATRGWLRLWTMRVDDRPIAFAYCLSEGVGQYVLKIGFDVEFTKFAPGHLLTREMLRNAFETNLCSYEFLGAADPYKLEWTDTCHELTRIQAFPPTRAGVASRLAWQHLRPLVKRTAVLRRRLRQAR